ncbi:hypothetical protein QAD02_020770 [Eretmocerus hayati]|uniref:Uncharacterized protein n=1 Tax=Eretmocerus hayati TaxID=131215 RepID=A0ACC2PNL2_9HYME|nr:hypothetical protein QAD02_020770 [Eretmocerus hayati]
MRARVLSTLCISFKLDWGRKTQEVIDLEGSAEIDATKHVINMFQRTGQLEKIGQYRRRIERKKSSVETMLKTAMHNQLDGVKVGFAQLDSSLQSMQSIEANLQRVREISVLIPCLAIKLQGLQYENSRHSQYVTAKENLKHIFTVPDCIEKTKRWINGGKLLHAHQSLMDLENSRDDLLYELHKLPNEKQADKIMLRAYFENVEELSHELEKQIKLVLDRTLNTLRKEPTIIVTVLRIIEREERADKFALHKYKQSGFMPPGRPKHWKNVALGVLEKSVTNRVEGTHVDQRKDNKMWLVRYLELTRLLFIEDLRVVKSLCVPCFPPSYDIANTYMRMYHASLSQHLKDIINEGLEGNEYVSLLSWVMNIYKSPEMIGHPDLNMNLKEIGPLLEGEIIDQLQMEYLRNMLQNYEEWMEKTLETEKMEWWSETIPENDRDEPYYHTSAPVIIFQMIGQNLQVTRTISVFLTAKALTLSIEQVSQYGWQYRQAILEYKSKHFEDRSQVLYFTHHMIAIVNNCLHFIELAQQMKQIYWVIDSSIDSNSKFEELINVYQKLRDDSAAILLEESFLDLELHFQDLLTPKWLSSAIPIDTICVTLEDYFQDYTHLLPRNFDYIITQAQILIAKRYISAMMHRKISLKNYDDCCSCIEKIILEADKLKGFFSKIAPELDSDSPFEIIKHLAEVLKCEDPEILSLDLHSLLEKYPDITDDQLMRLLSLRGDIPRSQVREKVIFILETRKHCNTSHINGGTLFKQIIFQDSFLNWKT